ncbi:hypothetical protein ES703_21243 [subsurface metagenome]
MGRRTKIIIIASIIVLALLFYSPQLISQYWVMVLISCLIMVCLSYGFRLLFLTGRLTIGAIAFAGIGAYGSALLVTKADIAVLNNPWTGLFFGALIAALIAIPIGYITLKVPGLMFAILTMAFVELVRYVLIMWDSLTGGPAGVLDIPSFSLPGYGGFGINQTPYLYLIIIIAVVTIAVMYRIERTRVGLSFYAMALNDSLARHVGMDTFKFRLICFVIVGFFAGMVGAFEAHYWHYVSPQAFILLNALLIKVCAVAGGVLSPLGPIVGAFVLVGLTEGLRMFREYAGIFFGGILLFVVFLLPGGLVTLPRVLINMPGNARSWPDTARRKWLDIRARFVPAS